VKVDDDDDDGNDMEMTDMIQLPSVLVSAKATVNDHETA